MIDRDTLRFLAIAFIVGSLIMGVCAYLSFAPQFEGLGYGVVYLKVNGYAFPLPVKRSVLGWIELFASIGFLIISIQLLVLYPLSPKNSNPDYEQYLYPSSTDEENRSDSL